MNYTRRQVYQLIKYARLIEESCLWGNPGSDACMALLDISLAIEQVCNEREKEFIRYWSDGFSIEELSLIFNIGEFGIKKKKQRISQKLSIYMNE